MSPTFLVVKLKRLGDRQIKRRKMGTDSHPIAEIKEDRKDGEETV